MSEGSDPQSEDAKTPALNHAREQADQPGIEREIAAFRNALGLLGLKQCAWCRKYVRFAEPGALFEGGELVCYGCALDWWKNKCPQLPVEERSAIEHKLVHWLIYQHHSKVIKPAGKAAEAAPDAPRLVASCIECAGKGKDTGGGHCSHCNGLGIIWVVLTEKH
ncbi:MAG: hypothetical protein WBW33_05835 [Bryobacteraceae bacterium]